MKTLEQCTRPTQVGLLESQSKSFFFFAIFGNVISSHF